MDPQSDDPALGRRGYAICTHPRAGSNLLCQYLASTDRLGYPLEYFNGPGRRALGMPDFPDDPPHQAELILRRGATNLEHFRRNNFGRELLTRPLDAATIGAEIDRYDPADAAAVTEELRREATLDRQIDRLEAIFSEAVELFRNAPPSAEDAQRALAAYLAEHLPRPAAGDPAPRHVRFPPNPWIDEKIAGIEKQLSAKAGEIAAIDRCLKAIPDQFAAVEKRLVETAERLSGLDRQSSAAAGQIAKADQGLAALADRTAAIDQRHADLTEGAAAMDQRLAAATEASAATDLRLAATAQGLAATDQHLTAATADDVAGIARRLTAVAAEIAAVEQRAVAAALAVDHRQAAAAAATAAMDGRLASARHDLAATDQRLAEATNAMAAIDQRALAAARHLEALDQRIAVIEAHVASVRPLIRLLRPLALTLSRIWGLARISLLRSSRAQR